MKKIVYMYFALISTITFAQVGIGTTSPNSNSILDLTATNKALLLPRVASTAAIANPVNGMMIYDISSNCIKGYENNSWTACLTNVDGGSGGSVTSYGDGVLCDAGAFVNPISSGTHSSRGINGSNEFTTEDRPILLDATGKKFYIQTTNFFYDLDIHNLYTSNGLTATSIVYKFPINYYQNTYGHWVEMKIFGQLFPTKTWKQFTTFASHSFGQPWEALWVYPNYWALLLSTDGELKAVRYQKRAADFVQVYSGISGRQGVGQSLTVATLTSDPSLFFASTDIKAYSNVNTQTATNWTWVEPYTNEYFTNYESDHLNAAIAYNAADNLWYSWGAKDFSASQQPANAYSNILLRTTPANITESMTPLPATVLNNLLNTLGTTVKMPTEDHNSIIVSRRSIDTFPYLDFITSDNKVVRYRLDNGHYLVLSMPVGVNPISIDKKIDNGSVSIANYLLILGSDGKLYTTTSSPTAVAQTGTISTFAHSTWSNTGFPVVKQYTRGKFIDQNGVLGQLTSSAVNYPAIKQTTPIKRIIFPYSNANHANLFIDEAGNFGEYGASTPLYNINGYSSGRIANYLYNRQTNWVYPNYVESFQFYPSKCSSY